MTGKETGMTAPQREQVDRLIREALAVRQRAYSPYSRFRVGAAIVDEAGEIFVGCNVENASYSLTLCAERVAAVTAIAAGSLRWRMIAVAAEGGATPCGACRQFLAEFHADLAVIVVDAATGLWSNHSLRELLPHAFEQDSLGVSQPQSD